MVNDKYAEWCVGDYLEELNKIKKCMRPANRVSTLDLIVQTDKLVDVVDKSEMGNGHGQKERIYHSCIKVYQLGYKKLGLVK